MRDSRQRWTTERLTPSAVAASRKDQVIDRFEPLIGDGVRLAAEPLPQPGAVLASDFFVVVTATSRLMYVFVVLEIGTRRLVHWNVTAHPTTEWTVQQFRMVVPGDQAQRFVIHDRDTIYSEHIDRTLETEGVAVLKTPVRLRKRTRFVNA